MKKYQYQINDRVFAFDKGDYIVPGTITAMHDSLYRVEYDCGGYDYLIYAEIRPLEYGEGISAAIRESKSIRKHKTYAQAYKEAWMKYFKEFQLIGNLN